jgi:hypothetical protein
MGSASQVECGVNVSSRKFDSQLRLWTPPNAGPSATFSNRHHFPDDLVQGLPSESCLTPLEENERSRTIRRLQLYRDLVVHSHHVT